MRELIDKLNYYQKKYDEGAPEISDKEWDDLYFQLQKEEGETGLVFPDSPTQKINYEVINSLQKVTHNHLMLSLNKTKDVNEVCKFLDDKDYIVMSKLDGLTCSLVYKDGKLVRAETRGNGEVGENVLHNARVIKSIPQTISYKDELIVDGEIVCRYDDFEKFKNDYKNPRNFAAGSIRLLDSAECAQRNLTFVAWDCISNIASTLSEKLSKLNDFGFIMVPHIISCKKASKELVETNINQMKEDSDFLFYPIDGVVFKYDNVDEYKAAGTTSHHPNGGLAFKFYDELYETSLQNIEWTIGRSGVLTPIAVFDEVDDESSIITRASLHNISIMTQMLGNPYKREKLWIFKANEIIPQVHHAIRSLEEKEYFVIPKKCPYCGAQTEVRTSDSGTVELYCSAQDSCSGILINKLNHFCGKKGLDIKGLSKMTLEKFINWGLVNNITDIFTANYDSLIFKPGFGEKSVANLMLSIKKARHTTFSKFISALGIPLIGKVNAEAIANYCDDWDDFMELVNNYHDFTNIEGFGSAMTDSILYFNYKEADNLVKNGIITFEKKIEQKEVNNLEGLTFVVTGSLKTYWKNRDELKVEIARRGGKVTESVTSKTNYLVNNDINSASSKNKKAKELNVPIITEEEMYQILIGDQQ